MRLGSQLRVAAVLVLMAGALALVLTSCPGNRDGMPGQLATAKEETESAARSGALALDLWMQRRSTRNLTAVQLSDARDQIAQSYSGIAVLKAEDPQDLRRQSLLAETMTVLIGQLNAANAAVRAVDGQPDAHQLRQSILDVVDRLAADYR
ncbi:hypothetical protein [Mycobacterium sp. NAZ190054]|uniref:hypothetical protein n=1 Tax=Mycobacterium sp. NAZ190054 TaxID=1747766 RepID=UPI000793B474|nr:hypothetical protein [Mycobacterium sp. NAZ190054]KWX64266.1 hypothetical protein ASJ79_08240 [Mycobacterium sp. NAZ190054]